MIETGVDEGDLTAFAGLDQQEFTMVSRRENARIARDVQYYTELLATVAGKLDAAAAGGDEAAYNGIYEREWTPRYVDCRQAVGGDLARSCVRDAYALARIAPEPTHPPSVVIPPAAFAPVSGGGHDAPCYNLDTAAYRDAYDDEARSCRPLSSTALAHNVNVYRRSAEVKAQRGNPIACQEYNARADANFAEGHRRWGDAFYREIHADQRIMADGATMTAEEIAAVRRDAVTQPAPLSHSDADLVARQAARDAAEWPAMFSRVDVVGLCCPTCLGDLLDTDDEAEPASDTGTVCARCGKDAYRAGYDAARAHLMNGLTDYGRHVQLASWRERLAGTGADYDRGIVDGYAGTDPCPRCHGSGYEHDGPRCIGCDGARVVTA